MKYQVNNKTIELFGNMDATTLILMHADHGEGEEVWLESEKLGCTDFCLAAISGIDWERDLSPWESPAVFKGGAPFTGGADDYMKELTDDIIPAIADQLGHTPDKIILTGYSLAGLFALYAAYQTDIFDGIVSASGSMWFPKFIDYVNQHVISDLIQKIYFSLGDKEAKTKNPVMQTVEDNTRFLADFYAQKGISTTFELNPGGHFVDDAPRLAKGINWILQ